MRDPMHTMATCFEQVALFFPGGDPKLQESFEQRAYYLDSRNYERERLADILKKYHEGLGANRETFLMIEELRHKETLAVLTGQQAGVLTGPLYTLFKAITVIRLAEEQRKKLGRPVVPIFWIAGEDHDWLEIHKTFFLNSEDKIISCSLPGDGGGRSVGHQPVPAWDTIEQQLFDLPEGEFKKYVLQHCRQFHEQAENLTQWFALTLQWLLKRWGLIFFDPMLPEFKQLAAPMYEQIIKIYVDVREALTQRTKAWVDLGFQAQIQPLGGEVNLFLAKPERRAILNQGQGFYLRGSDEMLDTDELNALLRKSPGMFSPNVVTRPVVQEFLFPTLAYVPGPGELNYWAQLGQVFSTFGFNMPILFPRFSGVILTPSWQKTLNREGLTLRDVYQGLEAHKERCLRDQDSLEIDNRLQCLRAAIEKGYKELEPLEKIHSNVHELLTRNEEKVGYQIEYLRKKLWQAQRKKYGSVLNRLQKLEAGIAPNKERQERVLNPLYFVVLYGEGFIERIAELPLTGDFQEQVILL
ncbi:bacillithiol biosynthesis cysteine-adding enzyme BshC [Desulfosporosinus acidiphilus SJ4]|uniref:Putative cysteine ligase BshC n=1 Tax=Desulfosporosinus acidiphilus (strain DSM 22704 / JCM 16185 / SJ4) TaxID=646529 RepID=I4DA47_DESAJ|nr:bacillithiol biosynthesis cysteine-adding enzyme BshC [Desulfosporosinus acidiphilus]AFM42671.1 bacillithiol biosynthesis cysteine-adding enzyme BshC [Desulfosporosinus acidiphilus SJ4]